VAAAQHIRGSFSGVLGSLFFPALFLLAYDTGGRSGVIWSLEWADYRPEIPAVLFRAERQKQRRDQLIKISEQTKTAIERIKAPERRLIFDLGRGWQMRYYYVKKCLKAAGLPHGRNDQLKRIRKTTLSMMHSLGGDATAQAGHSSDAVTRKHYLDISNQKQAADLLLRPTISGNDSQLRLF